MAKKRQREEPAAEIIRWAAEQPVTAAGGDLGSLQHSHPCRPKHKKAAAPAPAPETSAAVLKPAKSKVCLPVRALVIARLNVLSPQTSQKQKVAKAGFTDKNASWLKPKAGQPAQAKSSLTQEIQEGQCMSNSCCSRPS